MLTIALTGGSAAGKTVLLKMIEERLGERVCIVPELASEVLAARNCEMPNMNPSTRREVQREIYNLQIRREQETLASASRLAQLLVTDRGTIDGAAYWPEGPEAFWKATGTNHSAELSRYHAAVWLESCAAVGLYAGSASNPIRKEDANASIAMGNRILTLWRPHPRLSIVRAYPNFSLKSQAVFVAVQTFIHDDPSRSSTKR